MNGVYDPALVATSVVVAIIASYTALDLASSVWRTRALAQRAWLAAGSLAMGIGIWSMHFVGMLAFQMPDMVIAYDVPRLILSILVAIAASAIALSAASRGAPGARTFAIAGLAMGAAISGMHYIGMWSMRMAAHIEWRWPLVAASLVIAVVASFAALALAFRLRDRRALRGVLQRIAAGALMGIAIAGMHYVAMSAAVIVPGGGMALQQRDVLATDGLAVAVTGSTLLILTLALAGSVLERELARRAQVANERTALLDEARRELEQRRKVEDALRESEERLRLALDAGGMGIWEWDRRSRRIEMSPMCAAIHGLDPDTFAGDWEELEQAVHEDDREAIAAASRAAVRGESEYEAEYRVRRPDGIGWVYARGRYAVNGGGRLIGVCIDVTAARTLEERMRQSEKMEAIGQLAGGVAHDFNNLLTTIQGNTAMLLDTLHENDPRRREVLEVRRAANAAATLTRQLLAFGRRDMVRPRLVDLGTLVHENEEMLRRVLSGEFRLHVAVRDAAWIRADPVQIQQILLNLATNARDAMVAGGRLEIEVAPLTVTEPLPAHDDVLPPGAWALLRAADDGAGIEPRVLERLFEPFYTTKAPGKGTGLGLATVYGIVKQLGGHIRVDSAPGRGTVFLLYFPREPAPTLGAAAAPDAAVAATASTPAAAAPRERRNRIVLLVEDDPSVRAVTHRILASRGYEVIEAASAEDALRMLEQKRRAPDLLVTDAVMPGMNGPALIREARRLCPRLPALLISGYTAESVPGGEGTGFEFLQKPFTVEDLLRTLERLERSGPGFGRT